MDWLYLVGFSFSLWVLARPLWKIDQVYSIAATASGLITFVWGFSWAPTWFEILTAGVLFGLYRLYLSRLSTKSRQAILRLSRKSSKTQTGYC